MQQYPCPRPPAQPGASEPGGGRKWFYTAPYLPGERRENTGNPATFSPALITHTTPVGPCFLTLPRGSSDTTPQGCSRLCLRWPENTVAKVHPGDNGDSCFSSWKAQVPSSAFGPVTTSLSCTRWTWLENCSFVLLFSFLPEMCLF